MTEAVFREKAPKHMHLLMSDFGFSVLDAAAVMGNLGHESGGLTNLQEDKPTVAGSRGGFGWAQWTGSRRRDFEAYCKRNNLDPKSDRANYGFLFVELRGPESRAVSATKEAKSIRDKVVAFERTFERAGVKHYDSRVAWAQRALLAYNQSPAAPPAPAPIPPDVPPVESKPVEEPMPTGFALGAGLMFVAVGLLLIAAVFGWF